jgi:hypothetical protein
MKTSIIDLQYVDPAKEGFLSPPSVHVCLKQCQRGKKGEIYLTAACMSIRELDAEIKRLKNELSLVRAKAKLVFARVERRLKD